MKKKAIECGIYRHYKTQHYYEVLGVARHTETHEAMVVYKACAVQDSFLWVRPKKIFLEDITHQGIVVPRFTKVYP